MKLTKISHLGIAVESIEQHLTLYRDILGMPHTGTEIVPDQKVKVAFLKVGESRVELLEPTSDDSPVAKFLAKRDNKPSIHHVAYEVDDLEKALIEATREGVRLIDEKPRIGAGGVRIAFLHPKATGGVLVELCEEHAS